MSPRPAKITQTEVARIVRAAKAAGATEIELTVGEQRVVIRLQSTAQETPLAPEREYSL